MPATLTKRTQDARPTPRVLFVLLIAAALTACSQQADRVPSPSGSGSANPSASAALSTYVDPATGITFQAPGGLFVTPATQTTGGTTTQAIFSTYDRSQTPQNVDLARELVMTASVVARQPNEDLRSFAARNLPGSSYTVTDMARLGGILIEGTFQTGPRKYLLVGKTTSTVLVMDAFPTYSSRVAIFDTVLATLQVK